MKQLLRPLRILVALAMHALCMAPAQTLPTPLYAPVTANTSTGVLRTPTTFWTANDDAIASALTAGNYVGGIQFGVNPIGSGQNLYPYFNGAGTDTMVFLQASSFRTQIGANVADNLTSGTIPSARLPVSVRDYADAADAAARRTLIDAARTNLSDTVSQRALGQFGLLNTPLVASWPGIARVQPVVSLNIGSSTIASGVSVPLYTSASPFTLNPVFRFILGGNFALGGSSTVFVRSNHVTSAFGTSAYGFEFDHEGSNFEIISDGSGQTYQVYEQSGGGWKKVNYPQVHPSDGSLRWTKFVWPTRAHRTIRVVGAGAFSVNGVVRGPTDTIAPPITQRDPIAIFLGDSFTEPTGSAQPYLGWAQLAGQLLRWEGWPSGSGGTGWLVGSTGRGALITPTISGGVITNLAVTAGGTGYGASATLLVRFVGGGGTGATATATSNGSGAVTSVTLTSGGSGYSSAPAVLVFPNNGRFPGSVSERLANVTNYNPRIVVYALGLNDETDVAANGTANLTVVVNATLAAVRAALPNLEELVVVAPWWPNNNANTSRDSIRTALSACATTAGAVFIDPKGWITGTGRVGATTSTGNANWFTSADGTHPSPAGHEYLARRFVGAYLAAKAGFGRPIEISVAEEPAPHIIYNADPNGAIIGNIGDLVTRRDTGALYRKTTSDATSSNWVTP